MGKNILGWYRYESSCQNHKKVGPNLRNKVLSTYTLVYLIEVGGLCFPHLCTHMKNNKHPKTYNMPKHFDS